MNTGFEMSYKTKERKNDVTKIDMIFNKITVDITSPMMSDSYNSDNYGDECESNSNLISITQI
jgi:hypothetical protein